MKKFLRELWEIVSGIGVGWLFLVIVGFIVLFFRATLETIIRWIF